MYLFDPDGTFDIESLSILLKVKFFILSNVLPVQLIGTKKKASKQGYGDEIF